MVLDRLANYSLYTGSHPLFKKAFDFLMNPDFDRLDLGKHSVEGDDLFVILMEYDTKGMEECKMESHKKYIDIQYMMRGEEQIGIALLNGHHPSIAYNESNDVIFYENEFDTQLTLSQGQFAIFFPHDLHMPCIKTVRVSKVKKAVFKIRV